MELFYVAGFLYVMAVFAIVLGLFLNMIREEDSPACDQAVAVGILLMFLAALATTAAVAEYISPS